MHHVYFTTPTFAWTFFAAVCAVLAAAAWTDLRAMVVPKWLTLTALPLGVAFNVARGGTLGAAGMPIWPFDQSNLVLGLVGGLLFALAGFMLAFALAFTMWFFGAAGGGDVKLFAALGAWLGPYLVFWVLLLTIVVLAVLLVGQAVLRLFTHGLRAARPGGKASGRRVMVYSVPFAISTVLVLLWAFRADLQLGIPQPPEAARAHAAIR